MAVSYSEYECLAKRGKAMGDPTVSGPSDERQHRAFTKALLEDVQALELMIESGLIESGVRRIGAEQEMFLVDRAGRPAPLAVEVLDQINQEDFTTELGKFNLEANLSPVTFGTDCLRKLHDNIDRSLATARTGARAFGARIMLTGILPTLGRTDLTLDNMTPNPRYYALNREMLRLRGGEFNVNLQGHDEINLSHDNIMFEAANTSFQVHFQVAADEFAKLYNLAQAVTAPVLAAAVNSPLLLGRRLWQETRIALFEQSVDVRSGDQKVRGYPQRVSFGEQWVERSVLEIFREDITRFRIMLASGVDEDPLGALQEGRAPALTALRLHNGTVYRWNRACYGVKDGRPHLRIENRALPAGPTPADEVANAAFFFGLMAALHDDFDDIGRVFPFDAAKWNFLQAARYGPQGQFTWLDGGTISARELILKEMLPKAKKGLLKHDVDAEDVTTYLGIIQERMETGQTGARWTTDALHQLRLTGSSDDQSLRTLTMAAISRQEKGEPVHKWPAIGVDEGGDWRESYLTVGQFMTSRVFTVRPHDLVNLAASLMEWEHIKHVPVEDDEGNLVGIVSSRAFLRLVARGLTRSGAEMVPVNTIMKTNLVTATPNTPTVEAIELMRKHRVGCLPVVNGRKLVGIVTERDFLRVAGRLLEETLRET